MAVEASCGEVLPKRSLLAEICVWGRVVKFSHSIFALPFALSIFVLLAERYPFRIWQLFWIIVALVAARTSAMGFNRLADSGFDALNPRTQMREIPAGVVNPLSVVAMSAVSAGLFLFSSAMLGMHCLLLAPLVLGWLFFYSWTKRFTSLSHFVLGVSLAMAPGGVWYALTGVFSWIPVPLMLGVFSWVAGFDLIYACQDIEFDRTHKLFSLPAKVGIERAIFFAKFLHLISIVCLATFGVVFGCSWIYFLGTALFGFLVASQYRMVKAHDLSRVDTAFFTRNGLASVVFFIAALCEALFYAAA